MRIDLADSFEKLKKKVRTAEGGCTVAQLFMIRRFGRIVEVVEVAHGNFLYKNIDAIIVEKGAICILCSKEEMLLGTDRQKNREPSVQFFSF
jgi:hypothetical protein